jgi:hypothetical protein
MSGVRLLTITALMIGALITIGTFFNNINSYLYDNFFISRNISNKVNNLAAGQSINFFKQELGAEIIKRVVSENYVEFVFRYKTAYIQVLSNKNDEVIYWAITYCDENPVKIQRTAFEGGGILGNEVFLNKSTFTDIFKNERGDFQYFVSGATANSFAYESLYLGNPGAYQTFIIGVNDICYPDDFKYLSVTNDSSPEEIQNFRKNAKINTYAETEPFGGEEVIPLLDAFQHGKEPSLSFGVDRIKVRYFNRQ